MTTLHLNIGVVSEDERGKLSITQITVLSAYRQLGTVESVATMFGKTEYAVKMVLHRIREKGVPA